EVAGQQEQVGLPAEVLQRRAVAAGHVGVEVDVPDRRDPHTPFVGTGHSSSTSSGSCTRVRPMLHCTGRSGNASATTWQIVARRSALSTSPTSAMPESVRTNRMPCSVMRSSSASRCCSSPSTYWSMDIVFSPRKTPANSDGRGESGGLGQRHHAETVDQEQKSM